MITKNIDVLKLADNLKWDFQKIYEKTFSVFNYAGEDSEAYRTAARDISAEILQAIQSLKSTADSLAQEAEKLPK